MELQSLKENPDIIPAQKPGYFTQTIGELFGFEISADLTAWQTLQVMSAIALKSAGFDSVKKLAADLAIGNAKNDVLSLYKWVSSHMPFREDPYIVFNGKLKKTERIYEPWKAIELIEADGFLFGDCDDMATLMVSLLKAAGYRCGFIAVATGNEGPTRLDHVLAYAQIGRHCVTCDPASIKKNWAGHRLWKVEV